MEYLGAATAGGPARFGDRPRQAVVICPATTRGATGEDRRLRRAG
jgi:hypothetical protein